MKLRNKNTGKIVEIKLVQVNDEYLADHEVDSVNGEKLTLKSLVNNFVDVEEPLIKDEKIRKALRVWADANDEKEINVTGGYTATLFQGLRTRLNIEFCCSWTRNGNYNITELCGDEE